MPTIDLSNNNQSSNSSSTPVVQPTKTPVVPQQPTPIAPAPMPAPQNNWNDPWGAPWGGDMNQPQGKRLSPQERVEMIEKVFNEILGRKPDTRDINYYKYSTMSEEEIKKQLLTGNEHKQLLTDGRDYKKLKDRALQAETRVKVLEGQIKDQVEEFKHLADLLKEKNKHIQELREKLNLEKNQNPFSNGFVQNPNPFNTPQPLEHFVTQTKTVETKPDKEPSTLEKVKSLISDLF